MKRNIYKLGILFFCLVFMVITSCSDKSDYTRDGTYDLNVVVCRNLLEGEVCVVEGSEGICRRDQDNLLTCVIGEPPEDGVDGNGNGGPAVDPEPEIVTSALRGVTKISSYDLTNCAIVGPNESVMCWGNNEFGQVGNGKDVTNYPDANAAYEQYPSTVLKDNGRFLIRATHIAVGKRHACAIVHDNDKDEIWCWGNNANGQLHDGTNQSKTRAVKTVFEGNFKPTLLQDIAVGDDFTCILTSHNLYVPLCWGKDFNDSTGLDVTMLHQTNGDHMFGSSSLSIGGNLGCMLKDNKVYCFGCISGSTCNFNQTTKINEFSQKTGLSVGGTENGGYLCAIANTRDKTLACQKEGQNIEFSITNTLTNISQIKSSSGGYNCALINDNSKIKCWNLGNTSTHEVSLDGASQIAIGATYGLAISGHEGNIFFWGNSKESAKAPRIIKTIDSVGNVLRIMNE